MSGITKHKGQTLATRWGLWITISLLTSATLAFSIWTTVLSGPMSTKTSPPRTMDDYWRLSGLNFSEVETVFKDSECYLSKLNFLGCAWALEVVAEKANFFANPMGAFDPSKTFSPKIKNFSHKEYISDHEFSYELSRASGFSFESAWSYLKPKWAGTEKEASIAAGVLNAYYSVILDPHSYLMPFDAFDGLVSASENSSVGVGFSLRRTEDRFRVLRVITGSSADHMKLKKGDQILAFDGKKINDLSDLDVSQILKGTEGSTLTVTVQRFDKIFDVELTRSLLKVKSVESQMIANGKVGLLLLSKFSAGSCKLMRKEIIHLVENGARGIILDLRDNPGGDIAESGCIANLFLKKNSPIYEIRYFGISEPNETYVADTEALYEGALAVLVNRSSASASEVLAGALQDHGRAVLVGERTFGKGSVQRGHPWSQNQSLALFSTDALFYLPSGRTPQIVGLYPDIEVIDVSNQDKREADLFYRPIEPELVSQADTNANVSLLKCRILQMANLAQGLQPFEVEDSNDTIDAFVRQGQKLIQCLENQGVSRESVNTTF